VELSVAYLHPDPKTGILRYRRVFPPELRPFIATASGKPRTELKRTLGARAITDPGAMERYQAAHEEAERLVSHARKAASGVYTTGSTRA
jgi:hypothetical protein